MSNRTQKLPLYAESVKYNMINAVKNKTRDQLLHSQTKEGEGAEFVMKSERTAAVVVYAFWRKELIIVPAMSSPYLLQERINGFPA